MNGPEAELNQARDLPRPDRPEQRDLHRDKVWKAHRRSSSNMASSSQRDDQRNSQIRRMAEQDRFRRRVTAVDLSVSGSARRHLWAQPNVSNVKPVPHLGSGSRSRLRLVKEMWMKRAPNEKEPRLLRVSRLRRNNTSRHSSGSKVPRLPQPITARPTDNRKVERSNQKKRHRHIRNNFAQQHQRLRDVKTPEPFF